MSAADDLAGWLAAGPSVDGAAVSGWSLEVIEGEGVRIGVRDSRLGGAYEGPGSATRLGGRLELHWADGGRTSATLDRRAVLDPASELPGWRAAAFSGRRGRLPPIAGPSALPTVETTDPAVVATVDADPSTLPRLLDRLRRDALGAGVQRVDAVLRASRGRRAVRTSRGFSASWQETTCSLDLWADELAHVGYGRRALPTAEDLSRLVGEASALAPRLRVQQALPPGAGGVIFTPGVVEELLGRLLLPNLAGRAIRDGRSPFTRADLEASRAVIRSDLDLVVDTTLPLEPATAPCSADGVPSGRVALISGGRLRSPVLDPATAEELGLPPTPVPRGRPAALLTSAKPRVSLEEAATILDKGVVVRDLPGLHTQQPRRSRYALVAPDAQVVSRGVLGGRCAVRVAGNLLDHLTQPSTRLVRVAGELNVGLLVLTGIELLPA